MSRGLGRWQRLLLHELYHNPRPPTQPGNRWAYWMDEPWLPVRDFVATESEDRAARRAARLLADKGLVRIFGGEDYRLLQVTPPPCGVPAVWP